MIYNRPIGSKREGDNDRRHCRNASLEKLQEAFAKEQSAGEAKEPLGVFLYTPVI